MKFQPDEKFEVELYCQYGFRPGMYAYNDDGYIHPIINRLYKLYELKNKDL